VAIVNVARDAGLGFLPLQEEHFDFVIPAARWERPVVRMFRDVLHLPDTRAALAARGFHLG